jgi:hypothetical protein
MNAAARQTGRVCKVYYLRAAGMRIDMEWMRRLLLRGHLQQTRKANFVPTNNTIKNAEQIQPYIFENN